MLLLLHGAYLSFKHRLLNSSVVLHAGRDCDKTSFLHRGTPLRAGECTYTHIHTYTDIHTHTNTCLQAGRIYPLALTINFHLTWLNQNRGADFRPK